jgi:hypothetical protein
MSSENMEDSFALDQILPEYIGHSDACIFDLSDSCAHLVVLLKSPTQPEKKQLCSGKFEIRYTTFAGNDTADETDIVVTIWFTFKFGSMAYMDASFTPHLCKKLTDQSRISNACKNLEILMIDTSTGKIFNIWTIVLSDEFARSLASRVKHILTETGYKETLYNALVNGIMSKYIPSQIADMSEICCTFGEF